MWLLKSFACFWFSLSGPYIYVLNLWIFFFVKLFRIVYQQDLEISFTSVFFNKVSAEIFLSALPPITNPSSFLVPIIWSIYCLIQFIPLLFVNLVN